MSTGKKIVDLALQHIGEKYVFGARAPMANPDWKGPWDCAEFASWCVYNATGILYGVEPQDNPILADAYTGFWDEQAYEDDALIAVEEAARIPGSIILRVPSSMRTGHIVISDGRGGTIEAMSTNAGVVTSELTGRRWDYGIMVPGVDYFMNENPVELDIDKIVLRVTYPMTQGELVKHVQQALEEKGYYPGGVDGIYGPQTASAVRNFQVANNLVADGEVGIQTFMALGISSHDDTFFS